jgi:hypothetical protein
MTITDNSFPTILSDLHELPFDYEDGKGIDFEPYEEFDSEESTIEWFKVWTNNGDADGKLFRIFGQDGSGGKAAFWNIVPDKPTLDQPIVFFGSEGEMGVVAKNFSDYLWLLAGGLGPYEATAYPDNKRANVAFTEFATKHAPEAKKSALEVITEAQAAFPNFKKIIEKTIK